MFLEIGIAVILLLLLTSVTLFVNRNAIKESINNWKLLAKLPTGHGRQALVGHSLIFLGATPEEAFSTGADLIRKTPTSLFTIYLGPTIVFVGVQGPDEYEALTSSTRHTEKSRGYLFMDKWLEEGLLTSKGSKWQKRRKILTPAFHFSILLDFVDTFNRETKNFVANIAKHHSNNTIGIEPLISDFTLATLSETSMGIKLDPETQEGKRYKNAITEIGDVAFRRCMTPWLWYRGLFNLTGYRKREKKALEVLHGFSEAIINKRSENFQTFDENFGDSTTKRKYPLLDILLNAKFKHNSIDNFGIREEVDTFMFEGHDTTATCLNFTTMLIAAHKDIQEQIYEEIVATIGDDPQNEPSYADLQQMNLLDRCIKESLRLYPPVPLLGRKTSHEIVTKHGIVPKNTHTFTFLYLMHRNPDHWPNPEVFDPSRHLPENCHKRHPFAFVPFSAGPRNCIGQRFAMLQMKAFFCGLLRQFVLEAVDEPESLTLYQYFILRSSEIRIKFVPRKRNV